MEKGSTHQYDAVVVGAGIMGLGIARELTKRQKSVLLCDRGECHSETSSNSHRIIHGGVRYLQNANISRVCRALQAQQYCYDNFSEFIIPMQCYLPLSGRGLQRKFPMSIAGIGYAVLSQLVTGQLRSATVIQDDSISQLHDIFRPFKGKPTFSWTDGRLVDPSQLSLALQEEITSGSGVLAPNTSVTSIEKSDEQFFVTLNQDGETVVTRNLILALGSGFGSLPISGCERSLPSFSYAKAFNIVFDEDLTGDSAVGFTSDAGQVLFASPREAGCSAIGTWYASTERGDASVSEDEIENALSQIRNSLGDSDVFTQNRVVRVESGVLLSRGMKNQEPVLVDKEQVFFHDGVVEVLSTKYTTFPLLSQEAASYVY